MKIIVKGNEAEARLAAERRGVNILHLFQHARHDETIATVNRSQEHLVREWFHEHGEAPFPTGALLWFS